MVAVRSDVGVAKPFFKTAGGKTSSLPELMNFFPPRFKGVYHEPFVGGGALFFHLASSGLIGAASLGDTNPFLTRTYKWVRNDVEVVIGLLRKMRYEKEEFLEARAALKNADGPRVAALTIYLNKTCFNGLWRTNKKGEFNVPIGRYTNPTICDAVNLRLCSGVLKRADVSCVDFRTLAEQAEKGDFVYFDPPYWPTSETANFVAYGKNGFSEVDQERLRNCAYELERRGVMVVLSNANLPPVRRLYSGWKIHRVEVARAINSKKDRRGKVGELIISNKGVQR